MRRSIILIALISAIIPIGAADQPPTTQGCALFRRFVISDEPNWTGQVVFHASWNSNVRNSSKPDQKRCDYHGNHAGEAVCSYLIAHDTYDWARRSAGWAVECVSSGTVFAPNIRIGAATFFIPYGTRTHGSDVVIIYNYEEYASGVSVDLILEASPY